MHARMHARMHACTHARTHTHTHTHTHTFNGPFSGNTQVSRYQQNKTNLDSTEARDSEWKRHQLGHMQVCPPHSRQITTKAPHHSVFYRLDAFPAAQPTAQSNEDSNSNTVTSEMRNTNSHTIQNSTNRNEYTPTYISA